MGKSNKFDYTNRPNSGAKLGQIIGAALQKEAEKVKKDAEKHVQKARKQSTHSSSGVNDEVSATVHFIDLKAPSKDLTDEGVGALVDGLETALQSGTPEASLALEDLNLANNDLTARSLARLAPVIELAKYDLKTLNLADNDIEVLSDEEASCWEQFLDAFRGCMKLRRLDLSGNQKLGSRAMEILARVHVNEPAIDPLSPDGGDSTLSIASEHLASRRNSTRNSSEIGDAHDTDLDGRMTRGKMITKRCGLRSIPYITLHNIGLTDTGALWLSYVLEDHYYPMQLVDGLNATHADSAMRTYQQDAKFEGLDWSLNTALGKEGRQLLERVEVRRRRHMLDGLVSTTDLDVIEGDSVPGNSDGSRRASLEPASAQSQESSRRASIRSIRTSDGGEHEATEIESARKKIKRYIIAHDTPRTVELWYAALQVFRVSRLLLYISPIERRCYTASPSFEVAGNASMQTLQPTYLDAFNKLRVDEGIAPGTLALTEVTNTHAGSKVLQKPNEKTSASRRSPGRFIPLKKTTGKLASTKTDPIRFLQYQQRRVSATAALGRAFRDTNVPCHLPRHLAEQIMWAVMTERLLNVMSIEQRDAAYAWAQDRSTLATEREWARKDASAQVLMLLDSIKCLAYHQ